MEHRENLTSPVPLEAQYYVVAHTDSTNPPTN